jgi:peptidoglycan/LPS O-acetylase OafA/YrhL
MEKIFIKNIYEFIIFFSNPIIFEFLFGIIAFHLYKFNRNLIIKPYKMVILSVISYCFMAYYETNNAILNDYLRLFFYGIPSFTLVLSLCFLEKSFIKKKKLILTKKLIDIGNASYSIYLTHLFVLGFVNLLNYKLNIINVFTFTGSLLMIFLCIIIGKLTYDFIDKPISNYTKKILYLKLNNSTAR